jgi:hypothetical protein
MRRLVLFLAALALFLGAAASAAGTPEIEAVSKYYEGQSDNVLQQYLAGFMGENPFDALFGTGSAITGSTMYKIWITIAEAIAVLGFAVSVSKLQFTDGDAMRQFNRLAGRFVITGALIATAYSPASWSISTVTTNTVRGSYAFGLTTFGGSFKGKLKEAQSSFTDMLGATVVVGSSLVLPQAGGAMKAGSAALAKSFAKDGGRVVAAKESAVAASTGLKAAGTKVVGFVMEKLGGMFTALQYFLSGYGTLITAAGWLTVLILVGAPLGLALLNWDETRVLWTMFGTWVGVMVGLMLMPLILVNAIDTALVQPSRSMAYYTEHLGWAAQQQQQLADRANQQTVSKMDSLIANCSDAREADPANMDSNPCQKVVNMGALASFTDWMQSTAFQKISEAVTGVLADIADTFVSFGVMVLRLLTGVFLAGILMFGVPVAAIGMFSGVSVRK